MGSMNMQPEIDEIFQGEPEDKNKHRPRFVFEIPGHIVLMIKRNNLLLEKMEKHIEFGLKSPWLPATLAAKYLGISKGHLLHNLKEDIPHSISDKGRMVVFHVDDLDKYWVSRRRN